jgi:NADH/NAD ratio-sensing transcriptional regulator Rex
MEPVVTGAPPAVTEAVNVTFAGDATDDEETVSVVVVGSGAACAAIAKVQAAVSTSLEIRQREDTIRPQAGRNTLHI